MASTNKRKREYATESVFARIISIEKHAKDSKNKPPGRNEPCGCNSGKKFKYCCGKGIS